MSTETYSLSGDFSNGIDPSGLDQEIRDTLAITTSLVSVVANQDNVFINFVSTLSGPEMTALDAVVAAHDPALSLPPVPNDDVDHDLVYIIAGEGLDGSGNISANVTLALNINGLSSDATPDGALDYVVTYDASAAAHKKVLLNNLPTSGGGEVNTASNAGVGGVGVFIQKTGVNLEFKNINSASSKISVTNDGINDEIDIDIVESNVDHNALLNYVANRHIDHSAVSINAGVGLTGGGDITTTRSLALNINGLTTDATPDAAADFVATYDTSAAGHKKVLLSGLTATASNVGVGGVGVFKQKTGINLEFRNINAGSSKITVTNDSANNEIDIDVAQANIDHNALLNYVANRHIDHSAVNITAGEGLTGGGDITTTRTLALNINGLTTDPTPDPAADFLVTYDTSAASHKKVLLSTLPAGTPTITSILVSATAITSTTSTTYVAMAAMTSTPASGTYLVTFSSSGAGSSNNGSYQWSIYVAGTLVTHTERLMGAASGTRNGVLHTHTIATVNGSQTIDVRYLASTGTFTVRERSLILIKLQ